MPLASPSTDLYTLGRGILEIADWVGTTPPTYPGDYYDVGNAPTITIRPTVEKLKHQAYRSGFRTVDKEVILEAGYTGTFVLDEISIVNLLMFFQGTRSGNTVRIATANAKEFALRFTGYNPVGEKQRISLWRASITPNGDFSLVGDNWTQLSYSIEGLSDAAHHASSPFGDVEVLTTTTT